MSLQLYELFEAGEKVCDPEEVTPEQWRFILTLNSPTARCKQYRFIGLKNYLKQKEKVRAEKTIASVNHALAYILVSMHLQRDQARTQTTGIEFREKIRDKRNKESHIVYSLGQTTLLPRIYPEIIRKQYDSQYVAWFESDSHKNTRLILIICLLQHNSCQTVRHTKNYL